LSNAGSRINARKGMHILTTSTYVLQTKRSNHCIGPLQLRGWPVLINVRCQRNGDLCLGASTKLIHKHRSSNLECPCMTGSVKWGRKRTGNMQDHARGRNPPCTTKANPINKPRDEPVSDENTEKRISDSPNRDQFCTIMLRGTAIGER
jgi:hypothetical protein